MELKSIYLRNKEITQKVETIKQKYNIDKNVELFKLVLDFYINYADVITEEVLNIAKKEVKKRLKGVGKNG